MIDLTADADPPPKPKPAPPRPGLSFRPKHGLRAQQLTAAQAAARRQAEQARAAAHPAPSTSSAYPGFSIPTASSSSAPGLAAAMALQFPLTSPTASQNPPQAPMDPAQPVCIGLLSSLVLMLYPLKELQPLPTGPDPAKIRAQTLPVRIRRFPPSGGNELLKVLCQSSSPCLPFVVRFLYPLAFLLRLLHPFPSQLRVATRLEWWKTGLETCLGRSLDL